MANIEKRENEQGTTYRVKVRLKGHPAQTATFERLTDARRWAQQTEAAIREGRHFAGSEAKRTTLDEVIDRFTREKLPAMNDQQDRRRYLAFWSQELGAYALADVTAARISAALHKLATQPSERTGRLRAPATLGQYRQALSGVLALCETEWELIDHSPMKRVKKPKLPSGRVRYLSDDERERLLATCKLSDSPDLYPAVILALTTGARQAEIMGATWSQVDLQRRVLILETTKNGERRALPLAAPAIAVLQARVRRIDTDLIFPGRNPHQAIDLRKPWETALQRAGITDFRWHDLRHTAASYLAMSGASLAEIAEILGHKTLAMVKRYSHLSHDHVASVADRMAAKYFSA
ncbi:MAG: site-specific integrase [Thiomonas sp.]|uniref:tyrosine-type recombinase/integrase n=1 Tax=Thiomonas sp. TaxID=2047785 RepID=UPI002A358886|nr:site-specific integrase [Thiomonas sp.]MDY0330248.1 site-specific integrase [Thiomonas sp.]